MDKKKLLLIGLLSGSLALPAVAQERPLWLRYPALSPDGKTIAFAYQGDIYTVPTQGGEARRLTSTTAYEIVIVRGRTSTSWLPRVVRHAS